MEGMFTEDDYELFYGDAEKAKRLEISEKHLRHFEELASHVCNSFPTDDPCASLKKYNAKCEEQKAEIQKLTIDNLSCEAQILVAEERLQKLTESCEKANEELSLCVRHMEELTLDRKRNCDLIKNKHDALKCIILYYKRRFDIYLEVLENTEEILKINVYLLTQSSEDKTHFVSLMKNKGTNKWELLEVSPKLDDAVFSAICERLLETNNVTALLVCMRKIFLDLNKENVQV